jgi:hypothetical protein
MNPDELLEAARSDLARGFTVRAGTRLRQACEAGNGEALLALAEAVIHGRLAGDAVEIRKRLETAPELDPAAMRLRARWRYAGIGGNRSPQDALEDLSFAAVSSDPQAQVEMALAWAESSDAQAPAQVQAWLSRAGRNDLCELINGTEARMRPEEAGPLPGWADSPIGSNTRQLSDNPGIWIHDNLLSPLECAWLREHAASFLDSSRVYDPQTGQAIANPVRTGETACLDDALPGIFDLRIAERMAVAAGAAPDRAEPLAVLRYEPGQEYKPHYDWLGSVSLAKDPLQHAGDRVFTVLAYLNTPETGGATYFPRLDIRVPALRGQGLVFSNVDSAGAPASLSQHCGEPVIAGSKWVASLWLREKPLA